jgi:hypothetical protein
LQLGKDEVTFSDPEFSQKLAQATEAEMIKR